MRWEYRFFDVDVFDDSTDSLNILGNDGWEVCASLVKHNYVSLIMKRPLPQEDT